MDVDISLGNKNTVLIRIGCWLIKWYGREYISKENKIICRSVCLRKNFFPWRYTVIFLRGRRKGNYRLIYISDDILTSSFPLHPPTHPPIFNVYDIVAGSFFRRQRKRSRGQDFRNVDQKRWVWIFPEK